MISISRYRLIRVSCVALVLSAIIPGPLFSDDHLANTIAEPQASVAGPGDATRVRLQGIVKGILAAWDKADVVCLGEDHGGKTDSDLRITLIDHPDFLRKVNVIIVEFANTRHQDILDRLALEGEDIPRNELSVVWRGIGGTDVWELPIYEAFLRAVRRVNLSVQRNRRVRLLGGDDSNERNRGRFIREAVSREILSKGLKGLAIYGAGHCECRGMGFPGELESQYPGKIWAAFNFYDVEEGRRAFGLGDEPRLIPITGTDRAKIPAGKMFFTGRYNDPAKLGEIVNAVVYYGNVREVPPDKR